jgi:glyoxylase-like metal-dependent hydrolase (beta-lactamase superfamily II)
MIAAEMLPRVAREQDWYACVDHADGITHIFEPHIHVFYRCNMWFVRGRDRNLLFDSGLGVVSLAGQFPWLKGGPLLAVASHAHFDHIGCHHEFPDRACHCAEAHILAQPTRDATVATRFATLDMFERLPPGGFDAPNYCVHPAPATRVLEHGDVIDLGDRHFEVLHVPGHSPGSIALWEAASATLLSGDAVYDGPLIDDLYHSQPDAYIDTMQRLREVPVRVVHGGHYPSFGRDRYQRLIDEYLAGRRAPGCPADARISAPAAAP